MLRLVINILFTGSLLCIACNSDSGSGQRKKSTADIDDPAVVNASFPKASYNVYIENSGSVNGYVSQGSDFKDAVLGLITDLKSKSISDTININYINKQICERVKNALPADIAYFFKNLNPKSFQQSGCGTSTSYMPEIIKQAFVANPNDVNILISDFIFSDSSGSSPHYLTAAKNSIKLYLSEELKKRDFSIIILKLNSQYEGIYYVESQKNTQVDLRNKNIRRPYYLMVFGKQEKLQLFLTKIKFTDYKGFENSYYLLTPSNNKPAAKLIRTNKIGDFEIEQPATKLVINNAKAGSRNSDPDVFQFSIAANLEFLKIDESYLSGPGNYEISDNYTITSIKQNKDETDQSLKGFTHIFTIKTSDLKSIQDVSIKLKSKLPKWVTESSTLYDSNPFDTVSQHQTFGFEYLISGLSEAYADKYSGKEQFSISIKVSKDNYSSHGSRSKFPWWILMVLLAVVGIFIGIKNKN